MENYCQSCNGYPYSHADDTWTAKSSLVRGGYNPLLDPSKHSGEDMKEHYFACADASWTVAGNVTPANNTTLNEMVVGVKPFKEGFEYGCSRNTYARSNQTWLKQAPYTTN